MSDETLKIDAAASDEPKKDGFYISVQLPEGYEPKAGDSIAVAVRGQIFWRGDGIVVITTDETKCVVTERISQ